MTVSHKVTNDKITCLAGTELELLEQTDIVTVNVVTSWLTLMMLQTLRVATLLEQTSLIRIDGLAC